MSSRESVPKSESDEPEANGCKESDGNEDRVRHNHVSNDENMRMEVLLVVVFAVGQQGTSTAQPLVPKTCVRMAAKAETVLLDHPVYQIIEVAEEGRWPCTRVVVLVALQERLVLKIQVPVARARVDTALEVDVERHAQHHQAYDCASHALADGKRLGIGVEGGDGDEGNPSEGGEGRELDRESTAAGDGSGDYPEACLQLAFSAVALPETEGTVEGENSVEEELRIREDEPGLRQEKSVRKEHGCHHHAGSV
mmetsp:Transcript_17534/g.68015  ORF Transcript_17534/g.68015 Transcript_17534/m.68015 type:complete len:253 (+) Transcript_17534:610-1368(+)